jgi:DNA-binding response OmpR family regulator
MKMPEQNKDNNNKDQLKAKMAQYSLLIAEDDEMLREALTEAAENAGFRVVAAVDGSEALVKTQNQHFDVILIDMNLPKRLGHEVISMVRAEGPCRASVIVVLSGYLKKEVVQAIAGKVDKAFTKPADIDQVVETLKTLLEKRMQAA